VLKLGESALRRLRGQTVSMIFQDPASGLNPTQSVGAQIADAILAHRRPADVQDEVLALMRRVELDDAERRRHVFPHQLSGGQRQRVMIAMAIANQPKLLLADEPTTALDVTVQAEVMRTLVRLQAETGMGILFVTHNLALVAQYADRVSVMRQGRIVETGAAATVLQQPAHDYTRLLIASMPENLAPEPAMEPAHG
jgi:ABC-type dipeptide/oligopeptide/nickel transport system ATPase component